MWRVLLFLFVLSLSWNVRAQSLASEIRAQVTPRDFTTISAEIAAKVERVGVREGERFTKGQNIIAFDCSLHKAQLDEAKAAVVAAEKTKDVNKRLLELQTIGQLEHEVSIAEAEKAKARLAGMAATFSKCVIAAPFDGRVVEQKIRAQQFAQTGQALLDILDDSILELEFVIPSKWLSWLKIGHVFQVNIEETGKNYPAKLSRIGAKIDPVSQSIKIMAEINGRFAELVSGMSGRVMLSPP